MPGSQPADVQELLDHGAKVVVLSRGMAECLQVPRETIDFLKERRIEAHILPTIQAAELYNRLAKEGPVGGRFTQPAEIRGECRSREARLRHRPTVAELLGLAQETLLKY